MTSRAPALRLAFASWHEIRAQMAAATGSEAADTFAEPDALGAVPQAEQAQTLPRGEL